MNFTGIGSTTRTNGLESTTRTEQVFTEALSLERERGGQVKETAQKGIDPAEETRVTLCEKFQI